MEADDQTEETGLSSHARWVQEIQMYDKEAEKWEERSKRIMKRYKDERTTRESADGVRRYNILYSNIQTLLPAYYNNAPKPDIERRFKDKDPVGRIAAEVWERSTAYFTSKSHFHHILKQTVVDRLLCGRGQMWVRYVPHMKDMDISGNEDVLDDGVEVTEDIENPQEIHYEEAVTDYVYWEDFGHTVSRTWEEVRAVWRKVYLTREELKERFGEVASEISLDYSPKGLSDEKINDEMKKATIYEIWDKTSGKAIWLHKNLDKLLDERDDPLQLEEFFPCPRPLYNLLLSDSLMPIPDYSQYQDQAKELDDLTARIASITKAIKVAGVYDASAQGIERLLAEGTENKLIPIEQWAVFGDKGGISGVMDLLPMKDIIQTLMVLYEVREKVKADLYEITGISDIVRGASKASETATAQTIKGNYASLRLDDGQKGVERFARDAVRIIAQVIINHFQPETIKQISGIHLLTKQEKQMMQMQMNPPAPTPQMPGQPPAPPPPPPPPMTEDQLELMENPTWEEVFALLKDNAMRCFRIDVQTDSTLKADQQQEKQARIEFLTAAGQYISQAATVAKEVPEMTPLLMEMLMFGVRAFPVGKELETVFNMTQDKLAKKQDEAANAPQPPDPEMQRVQGQMQIAQSQLQMEQQKAQAEIQMRGQEKQSDIQLEQAKMQTDAQAAQMMAQLEEKKAIANIQLEQSKIQANAQAARDKLDADMQLAREKLAAEIQMKKEIEMMKLALSQPEEPSDEPSAKDLLAPLKDMIRAMSAPKTKKITLDNGREAIVEEQ